MEILTTTALALGTIVSTKALEKTGEKIGDALWDKSNKFLQSLKKHSSDTVLAIEEAPQKPLDYGKAILEIESAAQSDNDIARSLEELASIAKTSSVPELNEKLNEIFAEIQKSIAKSPQSFPTNFNQNFQKAVNVAQNQTIDQSGSTFNIWLQFPIPWSVVIVCFSLLNDIIGIVEFNNQARTILKATTVEKLDINEFAKKVSSMSAAGGTDINLGIAYGLAETTRFKDKNSLKQVYLFSDGNPSSGETNWIKIRQNLDKETKGIVKLSTFAFGEDANTRELEMLAGTTGGKSTFVTEPNDIQFSLQEDLSRR